jgi:transposase
MIIAPEEQIIDLLKAGWKTNAICRHLNTSRQRVVAIAAREGLTTYKPPVFADYKDRIKELVLAGDSVPEVAEKTGIIESTVYEWVRRLGLKPSDIAKELYRKRIPELLKEKSMIKVARELKIGYDTLRSIMDELGIEPHPRGWISPKAAEAKKVRPVKEPKPPKAEKPPIIKPPKIKAQKPKPLVTEVVDPDDRDELKKLRDAKRKAKETEESKPRESIINRFRRTGLITTHQPTYFDESRWANQKSTREEG